MKNLGGQKTVVKNSGKVEIFSREKLAKSLRQTFNIAKAPDGLIEVMVKKILTEFENWQSDKPEITSSDIRRKITEICRKFHPEASYIYNNFKKIL